MRRVGELSQDGPSHFSVRRKSPGLPDVASANSVLGSTRRAMLNSLESAAGAVPLLGFFRKGRKTSRRMMLQHTNPTRKRGTFYARPALKKSLAHASGWCGGGNCSVSHA